MCVLRPLPPDAPPPLGVYGESSGSVVPDAPVSRTYTLEHSCFTRRATKPSHESSAAIPSYCVMSSHPAPPSPHLSRKTLCLLLRWAPPAYKTRSLRTGAMSEGVFCAFGTATTPASQSWWWYRGSPLTPPHRHTVVARFAQFAIR